MTAVYGKMSSESTTQAAHAHEFPLSQRIHLRRFPSMDRRAHRGTCGVMTAMNLKSFHGWAWHRNEQWIAPAAERAASRPRTTAHRIVLHVHTPSVQCENGVLLCLRFQHEQHAAGQGNLAKMVEDMCGQPPSPHRSQEAVPNIRHVGNEEQCAAEGEYPASQ